MNVEQEARDALAQRFGPRTGCLFMGRDLAELSREELIRAVIILGTKKGLYLDPGMCSTGR